MKILMHHRIASRDGQSVHLEEMLHAFRAAGHEVVLVGPRGLFDAGFGGADRSVAALKSLIPARGFELMELAYNAPALVRLARAVAAHRPDVIYERFSLFLLAGLWFRRWSRIPLLLEVNSPLFEERARNDGLRLHGLGRRAQAAIWAGADHVLPVTGVLADAIEATGVARDRITVVPNGIDPARFADAPDPRAARDALGLGDRLVLGFTGFVRGWNAVHRLLDIVARLGDRFDLELRVVGDGPARASLEAHARSLGIADRLTITGTVGRDGIARQVRAFDIAVLPGVTPYSSPLKLFEYLALGRAIVAPDLPNLREILSHGHDALLFDPDDPDGLERAVTALCEDAPLRARLGANAQATIAAGSLTWAANAGRVAAIAERLIAARRPARRRGR